MYQRSKRGSCFPASISFPSTAARQGLLRIHLPFPSYIDRVQVSSRVADNLYGTKHSLRLSKRPSRVWAMGSGRSLTYDPAFFEGIQDSLTIDTLLKIFLRCNTELKIFQGHLSNEFEVAFKCFLFTIVVIIELHPGNPRIRSGTSAKGRHSTAVNLIGGLVRICVLRCVAGALTFNVQIGKK